MTKPARGYDDSTDRLVAMITQTNLVALDKVLMVAQYPQSFTSSAARTGAIGNRLLKAIKEIKQCLP